MNAQEPILALLRAHVWDTLFGGVFFFVGFVACLLAAMRRRESRLLLWFGLFIGLYGARMLAGVTALLGLAPGSACPKANEVGVNYVLLIPSTLFWAELTTGIVRRICRWITWVSAAIAALGLAWYLLTGSPYTFARISLLLAVLLVLALGFSLIVRASLASISASKPPPVRNPPGGRGRRACGGRDVSVRHSAGAVHRACHLCGIYRGDRFRSGDAHLRE
jgi:hypothetical protein